MFKKVFCLISLMTICFSAGAKFNDTNNLVFICHKGLNYSKVEVMYAFKGYLDEPRPIDNQQLFASMLKTINYTPQKYHKMWEKMYFRRALFVPKVAADDAGVIKWVESNYAGVGYVHAEPKDNPKVEVCGI
jgi:hypothetical protein